ncbi:hypothetical protein GCM10023317_56750 [Actinopolymorpha pittospori]
MVPRTAPPRTPDADLPPVGGGEHDASRGTVVQDDALDEGVGVDAQVGPVPHRAQVAVRRTDPLAGADVAGEQPHTLEFRAVEVTVERQAGLDSGGDERQRHRMDALRRRDGDRPAAAVQR